MRSAGDKKQQIPMIVFSFNLNYNLPRESAVRLNGELGEATSECLDAIDQFVFTMARVTHPDRKHG